MVAATARSWRGGDGGRCAARAFGMQTRGRRRREQRKKLPKMTKEELARSKAERLEEARREKQLQSDIAQTTRVREASQHVAELQGATLPTAAEAKQMTVLQLRDACWHAGLAVVGVPSAAELRQMDAGEVKERLKDVKGELLSKLLLAIGPDEEQEPEDAAEEAEETDEQAIMRQMFAGL